MNYNNQNLIDVRQIRADQLSGLLRATLDSSIVKTTGAQVIYGQKTFDDFLFADDIATTGFDSRIDVRNSWLFAPDVPAVSVDWSARQLRDIQENLSVDWNNKSLYSTNYNTGLPPALNWNGLTLTSGWTCPVPTGLSGVANKAYVDTFCIYSIKTTGNQDISGTKTFYNTTVHNNGILLGASQEIRFSGFGTVITAVGIQDNASIASILFDSRLLVSSSPTISVDWENRTLNNNSGTAVLSWGSPSGLQLACKSGVFVPASANMFSVNLNETTNQLIFRVKYANGATVKTGILPLS